MCPAQLKKSPACDELSVFCLAQPSGGLRAEAQATFAYVPILKRGICGCSLLIYRRYSFSRVLVS